MPLHLGWLWNLRLVWLLPLHLRRLWNRSPRCPRWLRHLRLCCHRRRRRHRVVLGRLPVLSGPERLNRLIHARIFRGLPVAT